MRGLVGQGGFAQVFEVWDRDLQRRLAVKVLRPDIAWTASMLERFREEARSLAKLTHPGILPIHFVGAAGDLTWYAMPFVKGQTLGDLLRVQGALGTDRAVSILRPVLDALEYAHRQELVHRDIKPDNVLIEEGTGRILLLDFGIAKQLDRDGGLTQAGVTIGSPLYMSPEQAMGRADIDRRSDIYALGALLYHMVTGTPPFEGSTSEEIVGKHITEPAPRPSAANAEIPAWLSPVI
ncbi:MAG: serine/threonine-protein kinase, partial [Gemmatimonadales bacterium]